MGIRQVAKALFDQFGRKVDVKKRPETREISVASIRDRWSTYPSQGLTPERLAAIFREADGGDIVRQAELFEEMEEKDAHLFSVLQTRKNAVLGLEWNVNPFSEDKKDQEIAEACDEMLQNIEGFDDALLDLLDAIGKGVACAEIMWAIEGDRAVVKDLHWVHQKQLNYFNSLVPRIVTEANPWPGEEMPPFKFVIHRYKARSGYDTRAGVLRTCAWMYLFKNYSLKDWVVFAEVYGMPLRLGRYEPGATKEDKEALLAAVSSLGTDAAGIISKATEIEFVEAQKYGSVNVFQVFASFCDKQMSKAVLGHTGSAESTPGKLGAEHEARDVRQDLIEADSEALAFTVRNQILRPFVGFNYGWDIPLPWFKFQFEPPEDLKEISEVYANLSKINYPLTAEHVSERFKVPLPEKGQQILAPAAGGGGGGFISKYIAKEGFTPDQAALERMVEGALNGVQGPVESMIQPVFEAIEKATSYEEIQANLAATFSEMDPLQFEDLVGRAILAAELFGRYAASQEGR